jgi:hypothetical protein
MDNPWKAIGRSSGHQRRRRPASKSQLGRVLV